MSYGPDFYETRYQLGISTGKVLNGTKPADLPLVEVTKVQLALNLKVAKTLGITVPISLFARADEVIE